MGAWQKSGGNKTEIVTKQIHKSWIINMSINDLCLHCKR